MHKTNQHFLDLKNKCDATVLASDKDFSTKEYK